MVKPSEYTPSSAALLAEVIREVGAPAGIFNVVQGFGSGSAGEALVGHPDLDGITFTGSSATGAAIMAASASRVRPVSFELGGKNAALVFADADLDAAVEGLSRSVFANTGQVCLCTERVYVQRPVFEEVVARLAHSAGQLRLDRPEDEATTTGPLISVQHRDKVRSYLDLAADSGVQTVVGGGIPEPGADLDAGCWVQPTLWTGMTNAHRLMREEVFGPLRRVGPSGIGREGGRHSLDFYSEPTNVCVLL